MKAITIRQPWAHAIVHLGKRVENRSWDTRFRGEVLIHAAKGLTRAEYNDAGAWIASRLGRCELPDLRDLARGGIVARARIVEVYAPGGTTRSNPWHAAGSFGFVLADVRPTPVVPCVGALGFWEVPSSVLAALEVKERAA